MEREKCCYKWFSKYFQKINRNVENKNSVLHDMTSEKIAFLQKQPPEVFCTGKHLCRRCSVQESTCAKVTFLIKLQARPARDSGTGVFL